MDKLIRIIIVTIAVAFMSTAVVAQDGNIAGYVTGPDDDAIIGANVVLEVGDRTIGASTDIDGFYSIEGIPVGTYEIRARYIGYRTNRQEVTVEAGETVTLDFQLRRTAIDMDDIVVTGTGAPVERRKIGNTVGSIDRASFENAPVANVSEILTAREPGMVGLTSSGMTGEGAKIRIRGSASLTQSNEPIVIVDGLRVDRSGGFGGFVWNGGGGSPSRLDDVNPESIERIEVLKGAAAATLYGTEASNGVIQIFTRRGAVGPPQFDFRVEQGVTQLPNVVPDNTGFARNQAHADRMNSIYGTNLAPYELHRESFFHDMFGTGYSQNYSGSVAGGTESITYYVGTRYGVEDGPYNPTSDNFPFPPGVENRANDENSRFQLNSNINVVPMDNFRLRVNSAYTTTNHRTLQTNNNIYGIIPLSMFSKPDFATENNYTGTAAFATLFESMQQDTRQEVQRFYTSVGADYSPIRDLTFDLLVGVDVTNQISTHVRPFGWNVNNFTGASVEGERSVTDRNNFDLTLDFKAMHDYQISDRFESSFIAGVQGFMNRTLTESLFGRDFPGPGFGVAGAAAFQEVFESYLETVNLGVYAQEQIGFDDYLFVTVGARLDANSAFGSEFDAVLYPKISASFIPSDMQGWSDIGPVSSMIIRSAIGQSGLQPGAFDALTTFGSLSSASGPGVVPDNLGNPNLRPEVSTEWELGLELGLFEDRASLETTYWDRTVKDALIPRQYPVTGGFLSTQLDNIGEMKAKGVEIASRSTVISTENFGLDLNASASYLWEQVTDLGGAPNIKVGGPYPRYRNFIIEGYAPGAHFTNALPDIPEGHVPYDLNGDGNPATEAEMLSFLETLDPSTADIGQLFGFLMQKPGIDGDPGLNYRGKPTPDWSGSFGFTMNYRNWSLRNNFEYRTGDYYVNNLTQAFRNQNSVIGRNTPRSAQVERDYITGGVDQNHTPQNSADVRLDAAKAWAYEMVGLAPFSGLNTVEKADFIRWRELSLTYNLPTTFTSQMGLRYMTFSLAGRNLMLWTKYSGVDPEVNTFGRGSGGPNIEENFIEGVEAFGVPVPRRITFNMRFGF